MLLSTLTDLQPWCLIVSLKWLGVHQSVLSSILPKLMTFVPCLRGNLLCWTCCVLDDKTEFVACLLSGDGTTGGGEMFPLWDCVSICWFGFKGRSSQDRLAALGDDNLLLFCWLGKDAKLFPTSADSPEAPNCINDCLAAVVLDESLLPCVKSPWSIFACARLPMAEGGCRVRSVSSWLCCESRPLSSAGRALQRWIYRIYSTISRAIFAPN